MEKRTQTEPFPPAVGVGGKTVEEGKMDGAGRERRGGSTGGADGPFAGVRMTLALAGALLVLAVAALPAAGCGEPETLKVGEDANGTTVQLAVGDDLAISLAENPTTGYEWTMKLGDGLKLLKTDYKPDDKSGELAGAGGVRTWWVEATAAGEHTVEAVYERPWESDDPQAGTFTLTVSVE